MSTFPEQLTTLDLKKLKSLVVQEEVAMVLDRLGTTMTLTSPSVPEQWEVSRDRQPSGYILVRWGGVSVNYRDAGGERLYEGPVDDFRCLTDHERPMQLLLATRLIAGRLLK